MAGVTFLAFGNGSPDVFSTFAAMSTHNGSLAVGELIGAAGFITAMVVGSMALIRPFRVSKKSFVRDLCFFIVAASSSLVFLADGHLYLWECAVMVGFYVFYVFFVVWHSYVHRRRGQRARESLVCGQDSNTGTEETGIENDIADGTGGDFGALEHFPNHAVIRPKTLKISSQSSDAADRDEDAADETQNRLMAEVRSTMRLNRPPVRSRGNTINPIRPSLVGALKFRAVLSSLAKPKNTPIPQNIIRRHSEDASLILSQQQPPTTAAALISQSVNRLQGGLDPSDNEVDSRLNRVRAVSASDATELLSDSLGRYRFEVSKSNSSSHMPQDSAVVQSMEPTSSFYNSSTTHTYSDEDFRKPLGGSGGEKAAGMEPQKHTSDHLSPLKDAYLSFGDYYSQAPNVGESSFTAEEYFDHRIESQSSTSRLLSKSTESSAVITFPTYYDDPETIFPQSRPSSSRTHSSSIGAALLLEELKHSLSWWPHRILPPPKVLGSTLFPTLSSWSAKNAWEKVLAIAAAPSVFLLVITLPVVDLESNEDASATIPRDMNLQNIYGTCSPPATRSVLLSTPTSSSNGHIKNTKQFRAQVVHHDQERRITLDTESHQLLNEAEYSSVTVAPESLPNRGTQIGRSSGSGCSSPIPQRSSMTIDEALLSERSWNRWLISTQVFTTPQFLLLVIWLSSDKVQFEINLFRASMYTSIGSVAAFIIILLTTSDIRPPRYRFLICFVGFFVSIAWISTIADEVVAVLKALGVIFNISDAILGLTIFAVGNSLSDLIANITVARLGYPVMALSACFGGPMLNILLGIGISGIYMMIRDGNGRHNRHPSRPVKYRSYQIDVDNALIISGATLLVTLVTLLIAVPLNRWKIDRRIGWGLVMLWIISTLSNIVIEIVG